MERRELRCCRPSRRNRVAEVRSRAPFGTGPVAMVAAILVGVAPAWPAAAAKSVEIVAKVGDLVITNVQVEARAGLLMQQSREVREEASKKASAYFKSQVQAKWKKIAGSDSFRNGLREYVMARRPTSKEEQDSYIKEYVRKRQKTLQESLQVEARSHGMKAVQGSLQKHALDDLVEENLKLYEAKRLSVAATPEDAKKTFAAIAQRNNKTVDQFEADLKKSGIVPMTLRDKLRADESWRNVIRKRFGFQLAYLQSQLDQYLGESSAGGDESSGELQFDVKRIRVGSSAAGAGLVKALQEAEQLSATINGCDGLPGAASAIPGAQFEDLGRRSADQIPNPVVRELLTKSAVGKPIPPQIDGGNVDVWLLCGREKVAGTETKKASNEDPRQKEFELLARRHLNDLKREVSVEYR